MMERSEAADELTLGDLRDEVASRSTGGALGLYVTGSSCLGGLRPDSDLDVLLVTSTSLDAGERRRLVDVLLERSGSRATVRPGRAVELTSLVRGDVVPWRYPTVCDFLYGEWLRDEYAGGSLPRPRVDPDVAVLLTSAREHSRPLLGPPLASLVDAVPRGDLDRAVLDAVPDLLDDLEGDERNVLLTLARVVHTLRTGAVVPKDVAAAAVAGSLAPADRDTLDLAAAAYRGEAADDWAVRADTVASLRDALLTGIRAGTTQHDDRSDTRA